jgi:hypothetical protein
MEEPSDDLDLPVHTRLPEGGDEEYDQRSSSSPTTTACPSSRGHRRRPTSAIPAGRERPEASAAPVDGFPQLEYDVGILARQPNALNLGHLHGCCGIFSRGTMAWLRAHGRQSPREERHYITEHFRSEPVLDGAPGAGVRWRTITPDLARLFRASSSTWRCGAPSAPRRHESSSTRPSRCNDEKGSPLVLQERGPVCCSACAVPCSDVSTPPPTPSRPACTSPAIGLLSAHGPRASGRWRHGRRRSS